MQLPSITKKGFDVLVLLISWMLWKERNRRVFDAKSTTSQYLAIAISAEGNLWLQAGYRALSCFLALVTN